MPGNKAFTGFTGVTHVLLNLPRKGFYTAYKETHNRAQENQLYHKQIRKTEQRRMKRKGKVRWSVRAAQ